MQSHGKCDLGVSSVVTMRTTRDRAVKPITYAQPPVELPLRTDPEPVPAAGCGVCAALAAQRREARIEGDGSVVSDCNVELRNHPHPWEST